ncbi:hypothetical protein OAD70_07060 [Candidatus Pelagibacter sp.]|mgnify:FL=1|nr:hypothetical protein [Candidatus Pelagibacter sp.]|tara:strand:- start:5026 stop:5652 length:627 start_codon:yes stop_codon:yes gene_type:complete
MKYKIIDNFLKKDHFNCLCRIQLKKTNPNDLSIYHNQVYKNGNTHTECISKEILLDLDKTYKSTLMNLLQEMYPEKVPFYEYSDFHIIETGSNYSYPIHNDDPNKLLSGVIYLAPENNRGTIIYDDKHGKMPKEIEWRPNRGIFFSRKENKTWHSYEGDKKNNRKTLVYNLMTTDSKKICEIEKINYYKQKTKEFLNPYIYRFFKKLI